MKASRDGVRLADMVDAERLANLEPADLEFLRQWRERLAPMSVDLTDSLFRHRNAYCLFEGAQGALLDIDTGTYPYVSSGMSGAAGAAAQGGIGPRSRTRSSACSRPTRRGWATAPSPRSSTRISQSAL